MGVKRDLGFEPTDRELERLGYDIESKKTKQRNAALARGKRTSLRRSCSNHNQNEILYSLNMPDDFILGMVEFKSDGTHQVHYPRRPFQREPDFGVTSVNYNFPELLARAEPPR